MRSKYAVLSFVCCLLLALVVPDRSTKAEDDGGQSLCVASIKQLSTRGSTRATDYTLSNKIVTIKGKTHVAWLNSISHAMIATYDQTAGTWTAPVRVGTGHDNHGGPALTCDSEGYLHIVFGPHGNAPFTYCRSARPNDSMRWVKQPEVGLNATYPSLVCDEQDTLHLVYRGRRPQTGNCLLYQRRPKEGQWSEPTALVEPPHTRYMHYGATLMIGPDNTIHLAYHIYYDGTTHRCGHMMSRDHGETWRLADGRPVVLPITMASDVFFTRCAKGSNDVSGLAVDSEGRPYITLWRAGVVVELWHFDGAKWSSSAPYRLVSPKIQAETLLAGHYPVAIDSNDRIYIPLSIAGHAALLWSGDRGKTFQHIELAPPDEHGPHRGFNFERPTGHHAVTIPWLLFSTGDRGNDCFGEGIFNKVHAVQLSFAAGE